MVSFEHKKLMYPVAEAREILGGLSPATFYRRVHDGLIRIVKDGRRSFVTATEVDRYLAARCAGETRE